MKRILLAVFAACACVSLSVPVSLLAVEDRAAEHPVVRPVSGSKLRGEPRVQETGEMTLTYREAGERVRKTVSGNYRYLEYEIHPSPNENDDETRAAVVDHFTALVERHDGKIHGEQDNRLIFSIPGSDGGTTWCRLWASSEEYSLEIVDEKGIAPAARAVNPLDANAPATVAETLERDGRVTVTGVRFAEGSATLQPGSGAVLDEIALLLVSRPELRLEIYPEAGASAKTGDLGRGRAQAVVDALALYGIDRSRLEMKGAPPDLEGSAQVILVITK